MAFADRLKKLDAHRLQQTVRATVQANGRLTFSVEATKEMGLSEDKSLVIFEADGGDLGAIISVKDDPEAFVLKRCGLYYYVAFKNYLQQAGIDYKGQRIMYDVTELDEKIEGKTLYKFSRRVLPKSPEPLPITDVSNGAGNGDGSGDGSGAGSGAGNGDGSGSGEREDFEVPQDDVPDFDEEVPTPPRAPSPRPLPTRPSAAAPQMPRRPASAPTEEPTTPTNDWDNMPF